MANGFATSTPDLKRFFAKESTMESLSYGEWRQKNIAQFMATTIAAILGLDQKPLSLIATLRSDQSRLAADIAEAAYKMAEAAQSRLEHETGSAGPR